MKLVLVIIGLFVAAFADEYEEAKMAMENPDLYDGDIIGINGPFDPERNAKPGDSYRWPNAVVPYVIEPSLANVTDLIMKAFKNYHDNTCVRFVPRTTEQDYLKLFKGKGCYSGIGRYGRQQSLSLGNGCHYVGVIIHELGHALGFYHEHSRSDRDKYIRIFLWNAKEGTDLNFMKLHPTQNILYNDFDYDSIMIYGNKAFSKNGKDTMTAINGQIMSNAFNKPGMTASDIERVNKMYNC